MTRVVLLSRSAHWVALATILLAGASAVVGSRTLRIDYIALYPTELLYSDLCALVCATVVAILARPRMWEWERVAVRSRGRIVAGGVAVGGLCCAMLCAVVVWPAVAGQVNWTFAVTNAAALAGLVFVASPATGPLWAGVLALVTWYGSGFLQHIAPETLTYLPISTYPPADPRAGFTVVLVIAAVVVQVGTLGTIARRRNDDD